MAGLLVTGCGPEGPSSLEGFGEEVGDGDSDPDPTGWGDGDGDPGDGDGDNGDCIDVNFGSAPEIFFDGQLSPDFDNDFEGWCAPNPAGDYALAWTAPFSGPFLAELFTDFGGSLTILQGGCDGEPLFCDAFISPIDTSFEAIAGESYTFVIDGEVGGAYTFSLFPGDVVMTCPDGFLFDPKDSQFGSTFAAGNAFASDCGGEDSPDRTYLFFPEQDGLYRFDTIGSTFDTVLHVIAGECGGPAIACNDDWSENLDSLVEVQLQGGEVYTIVVDGFSGEQGDYQINLERLDGPMSVCDGAIDLGSVFSFIETWPIDETSSDVWQGCGPMPFERRYLWHAPADGFYQLTQTVNGEASLGILVDGCAGGEFACVASPGDEQQMFMATAGQEMVFVSEWGDVQSSQIQLILAPLGGCGEDLGSELPVTRSDTTIGGGDDHTGSCSTNVAPDREYTWTAPADGTYLFSLEGSAYDTLMIVKDGGCQGPELGCNDDTMTQFGLELWSSLSLDLVAGQTVGVIVDGYDGGGDYTLTITQI